MKTTPSQSFPQQNRPVTMAPHGLVASPHYLASQAGVDILKKGGTAVDAAIAYARDGYPISHILSFKIQEAAPELSRFPSSQNLFLPGGKSPGPGDLLTNLGLAESLAKIARDGRDVFYQGEIARQIVKFSQENGGLLSEKDFQETKSTWGKPVSTTYRDYTVYETAPNSQGLAALLILNLLEEYDLSSLGYQSPDHLHLLVEAKKLAFADRNRYISDPERVKIPTEELLSKDYVSNVRTSFTRMCHNIVYS